MFVLRELLWSFLLFLLLPVEPRGLLGVVGGMGQGKVLLPWLLKPEVTVEEGEKPPLTTAVSRGQDGEQVTSRDFTVMTVNTH